MYPANEHRLTCCCVAHFRVLNAALQTDSCLLQASRMNSQNKILSGNSFFIALFD